MSNMMGVSMPRFWSSLLQRPPVNRLYSDLAMAKIATRMTR